MNTNWPVYFGKSTFVKWSLATSQMVSTIQSLSLSHWCPIIPLSLDVPSSWHSVGTMVQTTTTAVTEVSARLLWSKLIQSQSSGWKESIQEQAVTKATWWLSRPSAIKMSIWQETFERNWNKWPRFDMKTSFPLLGLQWNMEVFSSWQRTALAEVWKMSFKIQISNLTPLYRFACGWFNQGKFQSARIKTATKN